MNSSDTTPTSTEHPHPSPASPNINTDTTSNYIFNTVHGFFLHFHFRLELSYGALPPTNEMDRQVVKPPSSRPSPSTTSRRTFEKDYNTSKSSSYGTSTSPSYSTSKSSSYYSTGKSAMKLPIIEHPSKVVRTMQQAKASAREPQKAKVLLHPPKDMLKEKRSQKGLKEKSSQEKLASPRSAKLSSLPSEGLGSLMRRPSNASLSLMTGEQKLPGLWDVSSSSSSLLARRRKKEGNVKASSVLDGDHLMANARIDELNGRFQPTLKAHEAAKTRIAVEYDWHFDFEGFDSDSESDEDAE